MKEYNNIIIYIIISYYILTVGDDIFSTITDCDSIVFELIFSDVNICLISVLSLANI